jgi:glutathione peroxidase-family protein
MFPLLTLFALSPHAEAGSAGTPAAPHALAELALVQADGTPLPSTAGKVVLFVNVASRCGFTPQYDGLQSLYAEYKDKGFLIVGTPCNQFGGQEPGTNTEIVSFCKLNYGVDFPILEKADVNGADRAPLYQWLVDSPTGGGKKIGWNFEKFLVDRSGKVVARFGSSTTPQDPALKSAIDAAIAGK